MEHAVGRTPADVAGVRRDAEGAPPTAWLVELERRRADPANDAAKPFRALAGDRTDGTAGSRTIGPTGRPWPPSA
jgi:hypothetical protein